MQLVHLSNYSNLIIIKIKNKKSISKFKNNEKNPKIDFGGRILQQSFFQSKSKYILNCLRIKMKTLFALFVLISVAFALNNKVHYTKFYHRSNT